MLGASEATGGSRYRSAGETCSAAAESAAPPLLPPQSTPATLVLLLLLLLLLLLTPLDTARETLRRRRRRRLLRGEGSARRAERREAADLRAWRPPSPRGAPSMRLKPGALLRFYSLCGILIQGTVCPLLRGRDRGGGCPSPRPRCPPAPLLTLLASRPPARPGARPPAPAALSSPAINPSHPAASSPLPACP